jgi:hypothetical protein
MSFGRNPYVSKAEAEEQKAEGAQDAAACELAWREAGRQWERAAERETDKRRQQYVERAEAARARADDARTKMPEPVANLIAKLKSPTKPN